LAVAFGDASVAEEATQDAFAAAWRAWRRVRVMDRPGGWVYVVAANRCRRALRRRWPQGDTPEQWLRAAEDVSVDVTNRLAVAEAVRRLPDRQRAAVVLRYSCAPEASSSTCVAPMPLAIR